MTNVALNGFGRVGRAFLKLALRRPELTVAAINDVAEPANLAYLLRFDSVYGRYEPEVSLEEATAQTRLRVGAVSIPLPRQERIRLVYPGKSSASMSSSKPRGSLRAMQRRRCT